MESDNLRKSYNPCDYQHAAPESDNSGRQKPPCPVGGRGAVTPVIVWCLLLRVLCHIPFDFAVTVDDALAVGFDQPSHRLSDLVQLLHIERVHELLRRPCRHFVTAVAEHHQLHTNMRTIELRENLHRDVLRRTVECLAKQLVLRITGELKAILISVVLQQ